MPDISFKYKWKVIIDTMDEEGYIEDKNVIIEGNNAIIGPRTVMVFKNVERDDEYRY